MDYRNQQNKPRNHQRPSTKVVTEDVVEIDENVEVAEPEVVVGEIAIEQGVPPKEDEALRPVVVTANKLNVREKPELPSKVIVMVSKKDILLTADRLEGLWISVVTPDGLVGYVMSAYVTE
jgi:hypothetical protein